jgi:hypothetical protein
MAPARLSLRAGRPCRWRTRLLPNSPRLAAMGAARSSVDTQEAVAQSLLSVSGSSACSNSSLTKLGR